MDAPDPGVPPPLPPPVEGVFVLFGVDGSADPAVPGVLVITEAFHDAGVPELLKESTAESTQGMGEHQGSCGRAWCEVAIRVGAP